MESSSPEGRSDLQLGAGLALVGAAIALVGVFLPMADSSEFIKVVNNSLIQHDYGWIVAALALAGAGATYRVTKGDPRTGVVIVIGVLVVALAVYLGTSDAVLTLESAASTEGLSLGAALDSMSDTEKASPGTGIYAVGLGGLLLAAGGFVLRD